MPEKITFTEDGKMYGTTMALLKLWEKRDEITTKTMKYIPLCG
jgi:hypothetical protein